jgi:hypothetical protein
MRIEQPNMKFGLFGDLATNVDISKIIVVFPGFASSRKILSHKIVIFTSLLGKWSSESYCASGPHDLNEMQIYQISEHPWEFAGADFPGFGLRQTPPRQHLVLTK